MKRTDIATYLLSLNQCNTEIKALWIHRIHFHSGKQFQRNHRKLLLVDSDSMTSPGHRSTQFVQKIKHWTAGGFLPYLISKTHSIRFKEAKEGSRDLNTAKHHFWSEALQNKSPGWKSLNFTLRISACSCFKRRKKLKHQLSLFNIYLPFHEAPPATAIPKEIQYMRIICQSSNLSSRLCFLTFLFPLEIVTRLLCPAPSTLVTNGSTQTLQIPISSFK